MNPQVAVLHRTILDACETLQELKPTAVLDSRPAAAAEACCLAISVALDQCAGCPELDELAADARELTQELRTLLARRPDTALARAS